MYHSEKSLNVFCQCYDMLAWNMTFNVDDSSNLMKEKLYSCGRCKKGFSSDNCVIVHNLIHTLSLLQKFNIFDKNLITKHTSITRKIHQENSDQTSFLSNHQQASCFEDINKTSFLSIGGFNSNKSMDNNTEHFSVSKQLEIKEENNTHLFANDDPTSNKSMCNNLEHFSATTTHINEIKSSDGDRVISQSLQECNQESHANDKSITESLNYHSQIVKDIEENPYSCSLCSKSFKQQSYLTTHHLFHIKSKLRPCEKTLFCSLCSKRFLNQYNLNLHLRSHYTMHTKTSYSCNTCSKFFPSQIKVLKHLSTHEGGNFCSVCNKSYYLKNGLVFYYYCHKNNINEDNVDSPSRDLSTKYLDPQNITEKNLCPNCYVAPTHLSGLAEHGLASYSKSLVQKSPCTYIPSHRSVPTEIASYSKSLVQKKPCYTPIHLSVPNEIVSCSKSLVQKTPVTYTPNDLSVPSEIVSYSKSLVQKTPVIYTPNDLSVPSEIASYSKSLVEKTPRTYYTPTHLSVPSEIASYSKSLVEKTPRTYSTTTHPYVPSEIASYSKSLVEKTPRTYTLRNKCLFLNL